MYRYVVRVEDAVALVYTQLIASRPHQALWNLHSVVPGNRLRLELLVWAAYMVVDKPGSPVTVRGFFFLSTPFHQPT